MAEVEITIVKRMMVGGFLITNAEKIPCKFLAITHANSRNSLMFGWSTEKKDYWYDEDPSNAKFFRIQKKINEDSIQRGIYIGRLAMVIMHPKKGG